MPRNMPAQRPGNSKQDYQTPPEFIRAVLDRLHSESFVWDLAADADNTVVPRCFFSEREDALAQSWANVSTSRWMWLNPPFSIIAPWVEKAWMESQLGGAHIAMLVPASVGSNWWRDWVHDKAHVLLLNGRLTFVGHEDPYPKDCALLLYTPFINGGYESWTWNP